MFGLNQFGSFNRPMDEADYSPWTAGQPEWQKRVDPEGGGTTYFNRRTGESSPFDPSVYSSKDLKWSDPVSREGLEGAQSLGGRTLQSIGGTDTGSFRATKDGDQYYTTGPNGKEEAVMLQDGSNQIIPKSLAEKYLTPDLYRNAKDVHNSDDFGDLMKIALPIALGFALGPAGLNLASSLGMSGWSASAFTGGLTSFLSGGDPLQGALTAGLTGGLTGGDASGFEGMDAEMGAAALANSGQNYDQFLTSLTESGSAVDVLNVSINGPSSSSQNILLSDAGVMDAGVMDAGVMDAGNAYAGTMAENVGGVSANATTTADTGFGNMDAEIGADYLARQSAGDVDMTGFKTASSSQPLPWEKSSSAPYSTGASGVSGGAAPGGGYNGPGSGIIEWAKKNDKLATAGVGLIGSVVAGVAANSGANERLDKQLSAQKELTSQKTQEQIALDNSRREAIQKGSYFDADLKMKPGSKVLRRPDGTLVYASPGIIAGSMKG